MSMNTFVGPTEPFPCPIVTTAQQLHGRDLIDSTVNQIVTSRHNEHRVAPETTRLLHL